MIEEIEEMMQNSPDPEEEEEILEKDDGGDTSSQADSILLQEIQALSQSLNNNWSCEGKKMWCIERSMSSLSIKCCCPLTASLYNYPCSNSDSSA